MKMGSVSIRFPVGLWAVLALIMVPRQSWAGQNQSCVSSCGKISNISHPFRMKGSPENCGDRRYEVECVNDVAVLRLSQAAEYHVQAINYNNYTIRLVDPNIQEADCSSTPRYFLYRFNFSDSTPNDRVPPSHWDVDLYHATQMQASEGQYTYGQPVYVPLFEHILYMSCNSTVSEYSSHADIDTSCLDLHTYVVIGDLQPHNWKPGCHVKLIAPTSGLFRLQQLDPYMGYQQDYEFDLSSYQMNPTRSISYSDIHRALVYGFELSWLHATCEHHCGSRPCIFNQMSQNVLCYDYTIDPPLCSWRRSCRIRKQIRGFFTGMYNLIRLRFWDYNSVGDDNVDLKGWLTLLSYLAYRCLFGITILVVLLIYKWRRKHLSTYVNIENFLQDNSLMPIRYSYKEIKKMTKNFRDKLGQGGYGSVYKGKLCSGPHVAIKMLKQSKDNGQDFISEVATIGRIHHVNVVRLIGFCVEGSKRALVYDFMSNGSLDKYIFSKEGSTPLSYEKIYEISIGVACGISYLHQGCDMQILHFDIKPSNILLDENFIPKVSDFGLAKLYPIDHSIVTLTGGRGTPGYIASELFYNNIGGISNKADIYSFGMLLMEMANRQRNLNPQAENSSQIFFPTWVYDQFGNGKEFELNNGTEDEKNIAKRMIIVALWCIQLKPSDRPSMKRVVEMLEGELEDLIMPPKPLLYPNDQTFVVNENLNSEQITSGYSTNSASDFDETNPSHALVDSSLSGEKN